MYNIFLENLEIIKNYIGNGHIFFLYLIAVIYLLITEKEKQLRILIIYVPMSILFFFLLPLTRWLYVAVGLDGETYYRILWLLPMGISIAYAGFKLYAGFNKVYLRIISIVVVCAVIVISGSYVYKNPHISRAENLYNMPQVTINVCDFILADAEFDHIWAVFPKEHVSFVRQYSSLIRLAYGRDVLVDRWIIESPIYDLMEKQDIIDIPALLEFTREKNVNYIVFHWTRSVSDNPENYGLLLLDQIDGMLIYRDEVVAQKIRETYGPYYPRWW